MRNVVGAVERAIHTWGVHELALRAKDFPSELSDADIVEDKKRCKNCLDRGGSLKDYHAIRTHFVEWMEHGGKEKLRLNNFDKRFDFGTYLTCYVDEFMDDLLHIHNTTWYIFGGLWMLIGILAKTVFSGTQGIDQAVRSAPDPLVISNSFHVHCLFPQVLVFAIIADVFLLTFVFVVQRQYAAAENQRKKGFKQRSGGARGADVVQNISGDAALDAHSAVHSFKHVVELLAMRFTQAILLFMCYFIARFVGNPKNWDLEHFDEYHTVPFHWAIIIVVSIMLTLQQLVPELVVELNVMMRTPPFVDEAEGHVVQLILLMDPDCVGLAGRPDKSVEKRMQQAQLHEQAKDARRKSGDQRAGGSEVSEVSASAGAKSNQVMPIPVENANFTDPRQKDEPSAPEPTANEGELEDIESMQEIENLLQSEVMPA
jgi:hypothetical protein